MLLREILFHKKEVEEGRAFKEKRFCFNICLINLMRITNMSWFWKKTSRRPYTARGTSSEILFLFLRGKKYDWGVGMLIIYGDTQNWDEIWLLFYDSENSFKLILCDRHQKIIKNLNNITLSIVLYTNEVPPVPIKQNTLGKIDCFAALF